MDIKETSFKVAPVDLNKPKLRLLGRITERYSRFQAPFSERRLLLSLGDAAGILMAHFLTSLLWAKSIYRGPDAALDQHATWYLLLPILTGWFLLAWFNDLYHIPSSYDKLLALRRIVQTIILGMLIYAGAFFIFPDLLPRDYYFRLALLTLPLVALWRFSYAVVFKLATFRQRVLLVGNGSRAEAIMRALEKGTRLNYEVVGYVLETKPETKTAKLPYLGRSRRLLSVVDMYKIHEIVVAIDGNLNSKLFEHLVECQANGVRVNLMPELYERLCQRVPVQHIDPSWALYMMQNRPVFNRLELAIKRMVDLIMLLFALPFLLIMLIPVALAIKLESPGPLFYRQVRCGRAGVFYTIYKFRTMVANAEKDGKARWATKGDPRITRVGHFLRKSRLDELPQVLNVLSGEMSIVGPRPERPEFVEELEEDIPFYRMRLMVKPGITGWAQINYEYGNTVDHALVKLQYDFYYVRYWSIWLDLYILFRTVGVMLRFKGT